MLNSAINSNRSNQHNKHSTCYGASYYWPTGEKICNFGVGWTKYKNKAYDLKKKKKIEKREELDQCVLCKEINPFSHQHVTSPYNNCTSFCNR